MAYTCRILRLVVFAAALGVGLCTAYSQQAITINVDSRVKGLHYDPDTMSGDGQAVPFTFSVTVPPGETFVNAGWTVDGTPVPNSNSTTITYKAEGAHKHTVHISMTTRRPPFISYVGSLTFASIGGPLSYGVSGREAMPDMYKEVPAHDDQNVVKPFHIQYFDYAASGSKPADAQAEQYGWVLVNPGPTGTTYEWKISGPATFWPGHGGLSAQNVNVDATAGSTRGEIKVRVTYHFTDPSDPTLTGSADDDSEETPPPGQTEAAPAYYSFTSHRPTRVEKLSGPILESHIEGTFDKAKPDSTPWTWQDKYEHILYDQNGDGQPGVWVTERFPDAQAQLDRWNYDWGQSLGRVDAGTMGIWWTTYNYAVLQNNTMVKGQFDNLDLIGLTGAIGVTDHLDPRAFLALVFEQDYFAATKNTTIGAFGLLVQVWSNSMKANAESHEKS